MHFKIKKPYRGTVQTLNVIPFVDILFQLIIFFALIYKVAEMEIFPVTVPDGCKFAQKQEQSQPGTMTITVMRSALGRAEFAVGPEKVAMGDYKDLSHRLAELIDSRMKNVPANERLVTLRVDRNIGYGQAQYAIAGIAESSAKDIKLAVLKSKNTDE